MAPRRRSRRTGSPVRRRSSPRLCRRSGRRSAGWPTAYPRRRPATGIARVSFAEAGNQGDSGLAAVVYTILNRLADGRWGDTVDAVLNARDQFEPVLRAGGDWRRLAPVSPAQQARIDTIINLALGRAASRPDQRRPVLPEPDDRRGSGARRRGLAEPGELRRPAAVGGDRRPQLLCRRGRGDGGRRGSVAATERP